MALNWTTIENAIRAWVKTGSSFVDAKIIWAEQNGPMPANDFITIRIGDVIALGTKDEIQYNTDLLRAAGTEIEISVQGAREFSVSIQCFGNSITGASTTRETLSKVQTALHLPSVRHALNTAGIAPFDMGKIQNVTAHVQTKFEARSILEVRFSATESLSEYTGYINTVETTDYTDNDTIDI